MSNPILASLAVAQQQAPMPEWPFAERPDFTRHFNTALTAGEQAEFVKWAESEAANRGGRDPRHDMFDYDMPGFWKASRGFDERGHATDEFKKPNHPTFSDQSKYATSPGMQPGSWVEHPSGKVTFQAGPANLRYMTPAQLQHYFRDVEPDVELRLP